MPLLRPIVITFATLLAGRGAKHTTAAGRPQLALPRPSMEQGPSATMSGPTTITQAGSYTYTLCASGLANDTYAYETLVNGSVVQSTKIYGNGCTNTQVSVAWNTPSFTVSGRIINVLGQVAATSNTLSVVVNIPQLAVSISGPAHMGPGNTCNYTASASGGTAPYTYSWSFSSGGAGYSPSNGSFVLTAESSGNYTISLSVVASDANGLQGGATQSVSVSTLNGYCF